jgi:hypothetical protein
MIFTTYHLNPGGQKHDLPGIETTEAPEMQHPRDKGLHKLGK